MPETRFLVYTREGCALCDEFILELSRELGAAGPAFGLRDVDADPELQRRYGYKVPVLTCDGSVVCHGHLDRRALARLVRD